MSFPAPIAAAPPPPPPEPPPPDPEIADSDIPVPVPAEPEVAEAAGEGTSASWIPGVHRVVVHTVEGQVKRGLVEDVDLAAEALSLQAQPSGAVELLPADKVKAVFFMLAPGEQPLAPSGKRVRVTFCDGRQVAGFSPDYREGGPGFFMIPADARTSTGRIWVYHSAVRQVSVS
jgi:hypothetical protein